MLELVGFLSENVSGGLVMVGGLFYHMSQRGSEMVLRRAIFQTEGPVFADDQEIQWSQFMVRRDNGDTTIVLEDEVVRWRHDGAALVAVAGFDGRIYATFANGDLYAFLMDGTSQYVRGGIPGQFAIRNYGALSTHLYVLAAPGQDVSFNVVTGEEGWMSYDEYRGQLSPTIENRNDTHYRYNNDLVILTSPIQQLLIYNDVAVARTSTYTAVFAYVPGPDPFLDTVNALIQMYDINRTPALQRALSDCRRARQRNETEIERLNANATTYREALIACQTRQQQDAAALARCDAELAERDARLAVAGAAAELCTICMERPRTHTYGPCGHVFCADCVARMPDGCPQCRGRRDPRPLFYP